jgi:hypothetical protein
MSSDIKVTFEYDSKTIRDHLVLGSLLEDQETQEFVINIRHNSNRPIRDCQFYLSPYSGIYNGSANPVEDYKRLLWYGDNYSEYGLSVEQEYTVFGEVYIQESNRMIDITRTEESDFFAGNQIEIISGPLTGEKQTIRSYDPSNNLFFLVSDFSGPVNNERYKIDIKTKYYVKSKSGSSSEFAVPLLYNGGKINRFETASIKMKLKVPPFMRAAGISLLNFNMKYTPEE